MIIAEQMQKSMYYKKRKLEIQTNAFSYGVLLGYGQTYKHISQTYYTIYPVRSNQPLASASSNGAGRSIKSAFLVQWEGECVSHLVFATIFFIQCFDSPF